MSQTVAPAVGDVTEPGFATSLALFNSSLSQRYSKTTFFQNLNQLKFLAELTVEQYE